MNSLSEREHINIPPIIELKTSLSICFIGMINNFPNINIAKVHDKKIIIVLVLSIGLSSHF